MAYKYNFATGKLDFYLPTDLPVVPEVQVFFSTTLPTDLGVIFTPDTPSLENVLYISEITGQVFIYNGTSYTTYIPVTPNNTAWYLKGTTIDAGGSKTSSIQRSGSVTIDGTFTNFWGHTVLNRGTTGANGLYVAINGSTSGVPFQVNKGAFNYFTIANNGTVSTKNYALPLADGTTNQFLQTNGAGVTSWADAGGSSSANTIYVDSIYGVNSTGRGSASQPYLTPEYALANTTNTGTVTATTTNLSATLTAVSSTENIQVGQYITGTGIPYNSTVVSKTVNTIVLSNTCTANATITATWWTAYKVVLIGNFNITSSICKQGFFIDAQTYKSNLTFGAITLFSFDVDYLIPHYTYLYNVNGTSSSSIFAKGTIAYADVTDWYLTFNNVYTIGTSWAIGNSSNLLALTNFYVKGNRFEAAFGYATKVVATYWDVKYTYGLLGGHMSGLILGIGDIVCPTSVTAVAYCTNYYGNITGNMSSYNSNIYGNINCSVLTTSNGGSGTLFRSNFYGNVIATTFNNGSFTEIHGTFQGNLVNNGVTAVWTQCNFLNAIIGGSITITNGSVYHNAYSQGGGTINVNGGSFYNKGYLACGFITMGSGSLFENYGNISTSEIQYTSTGKFINYGKVTSSGGESTTFACVNITNGGTFVNNGTVSLDNIGYHARSTIIKTSGNFINNGFIYNGFGLLVNYTVNTIPGRNIALGNARNNMRTGGGSSLSGNGRIFRLDISLANTNTSITLNDGTGDQTFSVTGAGKSISTIISELIVLINASTLIFGSATYNSNYGSLRLVEGILAPLTLSSLTNIVLTSTTPASFTGNEIAGGTDLSSIYFTN